MTDRLSPERRSALMSHVKSKDTGPEKIVRSWLHRHGYRFRLHRKDLPGSPDIVLSKYRTVVFVHGCFWHRHPGCRRASRPSTNVEFWERKFRTNVERDAVVRKRLEALGWKVVVIWECETRKTCPFVERLVEAFDVPEVASKGEASFSKDRTGHKED